MMGSNKVVTRIRRDERSGVKEFNFNYEDIPFINDPDISDAIRDYYKLAWDHYKQQLFPTITDEAWRRTDLRRLDVEQLKIKSDKNGIDSIKIPQKLLEPLGDAAHGGRIVISPLDTQIYLDPGLSQMGVVFTDFSHAAHDHPEILEKILGQIVRSDEGKFAAMASALSKDGILLYVPPGITVEAPINGIFWGPEVRKAYFSHLLIYVDDGASVTYIHETASTNQVNTQSLHAGIVEIHVGDHSNLKFVELQSWGNHVWNFSHERARVGQDGNLDWVFGAIGSQLTKNFSDIDLVGVGASARMSGFYFTNQDQHFDHDTQQNHYAPSTSSDLLFKGALRDESRSVWQGMIYVAPGAQKTDGYQANRNLVLSKKARADSIPGLEILADDVRCTHGATVGKIDEEQVFYLRSRGISYNDAEQLIVEGFFDPIMQRIPFEAVRSRFQNAIIDKMS